MCLQLSRWDGIEIPNSQCKRALQEGKSPMMVPFAGHRQSYRMNYDIAQKKKY